jgi:hypothetical protein
MRIENFTIDKKSDEDIFKKLGEIVGIINFGSSILRIWK